MSVIKYNEYDVNELDFEHIAAAAKRKSTQTILFPLYKGERSPNIQLPNIELTSYGVPTKCEFFKEDYQRQFVKIPLDASIPEVALLMDWIRKLDERMAKQDIKEKAFGKKNPKANYQTCLRTPMTEDGQPRTDRLPYMKVKLMSKYPSNEITTNVIIQNPDGSKQIVYDTTSVDDVADTVRFKSKIKCIILPSKLWIIPPAGGDAMYGVSFKLVKVLVELPPKREVTTETILDGFLSEEDPDL